ncbi:hypothetical protein Q7P37_005017 [Cladosporium fusiforme]
MSDRTKVKRNRTVARAAKHNADQAMNPQADGNNNNNNNQHRIIRTRSRTAQFPLLRLPAELRNNIYAHALKSSSKIPLRSLEIPPLLQVSQQLRREALGLLTSVNDIKLVVRCNYCVVGGHVAGDKPLHKFYHSTGLLALDAARRAWMQAQDVVFRSLEIEVLCCCCDRTSIGVIGIRVPDGSGEFLVSFEPHTVRDPQGLEMFFDGVRTSFGEVLREAEGRTGVLGLRFGDLERIVGCFRWAGKH